MTGLFGAFSVVTALYQRDALHGPGQVIDLALYESLFRLMDFDAIQYDKTGMVHTRCGNQVAYAAPSSTYRTSDGKYITMAASSHNVWLRLCDAMDRKDLPINPKYETNVSRVTHSDEINQVVADWIGARTRDEVVERFNAHGVAFSVIYDITDIFADPQYAARETMIRVADSDLGEAIVPNVIPKFSETPGAIKFLKLWARTTTKSIVASSATRLTGSKRCAATALFDWERRFRAGRLVQEAFDPRHHFREEGVGRRRGVIVGAGGDAEHPHEGVVRDRDGDGRGMGHDRMGRSRQQRDATASLHQPAEGEVVGDLFH